MRLTRSLLVALTVALSTACSQPDAPAAAAAASAAPTPDTAALQPGAAAVGKPAPDFTLTDLDGKAVKLSDHRGKIVVLEWFNPECPFVKRNHGQGSLKGLAKKLADKNVVFLAINSGAPGKQGAGAEANRAGRERFGIDYPILLDEGGQVGKAYGATATPHMFVVDPAGVLVYRGAIDNAPDGDADEGVLKNHVEAAIADLEAKRPVATPETKAYGCSVKYGS